MFAKIFGQIFDSSIAEDYNCRRMFMDLLVLADRDGVIDMTHEAISRRTNVPIEEVQKYIIELQQPDNKSRSKMEEGRRLVPVDSHRDWGWKVVNYHHYRKIRDDEIRRQYFRDKMRKYRALRKSVKYTGLTDGDKVPPKRTKLNTVKTPDSASTSKNRCSKEEAEEYCKSIGLPPSDGEAMWLHWQEKGWAKVKDWKLTIQKWKSFGYLPSQKGQRSARSMSAFEIEKRKAAISEEINKIFKSNGSKRVEGDGIDALKKLRDTLQRRLTEEGGKASTRPATGRMDTRTR